MKRAFIYLDIYGWKLWVWLWKPHLPSLPPTRHRFGPVPSMKFSVWLARVYNTKRIEKHRREPIPPSIVAANSLTNLKSCPLKETPPAFCVLCSPSTFCLFVWIFDKLWGLSCLQYAFLCFIMWRKRWRFCLCFFVFCFFLFGWRCW